MIVGINPLGLLVMLGVMSIAAGLYYKTPIPVQPMKAIGSAAVAHAALITPGMVWGAGIFTGIFWLLAGKTGVLDFIAKMISKPVTRGIVLGLGISFIMEGLKMMRSDFIIALIALIMTFVLLTNKRIPAMFVLIVFGLLAAFFRTPDLFKELSAIHFDFKLPYFALGQVTWSELLKGALLLGLPQIPLTLGNAVIAVTSENNRLFPERPVTEGKVAIFQGVINLISPLFGGIPVCHGAGGMAGHVRFGAHTGGALIIIGVFLLVIGLCFSSSVLLLFKIFPLSVLGVVLFFAGLELASAARDVGKEKSDYYLLLVTAGFSIWNMGIGFLIGVITQELFKRKIFKV